MGMSVLPGGEAFARITNCGVFITACGTTYSSSAEMNLADSTD